MNRIALRLRDEQFICFVLFLSASIPNINFDDFEPALLKEKLSMYQKSRRTLSQAPQPSIIYFIIPLLCHCTI